MERSLFENRIHGDALFPLSVYRVEVTGDHLFPCHWHDELELDLVQEGNALFQIDAGGFEAAAGQAVFINSRELHAAYPAAHTPCALHALVFHPSLLAGVGYDDLQNRYIAPVLRKDYALPALILGEADWEKELLGHLNAIITLEAAQPFTYELLIKARLYQIVALLIANSGRATARKNFGAQQEQLARIKTILQYIQTHYSQRIRIKDLAAMEHVSEAHFCRFFKQMVRKTPVDYINYYRIQKAAQLLEDDSKKITDVGMDVGFENFSYFIQTFKHYMKLTPSEYRKKHRESLPGNEPGTPPSL
jgi:AraC-like DNA-binding protein/quercetin dioxygenase-like cupin family protein